jgi:hypothetical protein
MGEHGRRGHADTNRIQAHVDGRARFSQRHVDALLQVGRRAEPALADGKMHPCEAGVELRAPELLPLGGRGRELGQQLVCGLEDFGFSRHVAKLAPHNRPKAGR